MNDLDKLIAEYSADYCHFIEATYSEDMMSEGGTEAIENMFAHVDVQGKRILDIGFGLGGVAFYLADTYQARVTGLEINPWMVDEASRRTPEHLKPLVDFMQYDDISKLGFPDVHFDIIYSKGVLTHVCDKLPLFKEIHRLLKPEGSFIVDDWLSPTPDQWGPRLQRMMEAEDLTLYAMTETNYMQLLTNAGFVDIKMRDENINYNRYNESIVHRLKSDSHAADFIKQFGQKDWDIAIESYQNIADAIKDNELLIRWFNATKK